MALATPDWRLCRTRIINIGKYDSFDEFNLYINELIENLSFGIEAEKFESALKNLGEMLGYVSQRPDKEIRKGPDNLWCVSNKKYVFFECIKKSILFLK